MYELLYPLPPKHQLKQALGSNNNCCTNDNLRIWKGLSTNLSYYRPGTSGSKKKQTRLWTTGNKI